MKVYYNDNDKFVCEWLYHLMKQGAIPDGEIDNRSISKVTYSEVRDFDQAHFFAGIGGWAYALKLAGWDEPCWTGSCPCQPFSSAGRRKGVLDERHLWPEFRRLIEECRPSVVFGEQVESKDGRLWLSGVRSDLEELDYAVGAVDLCSAGVGAPHRRQRIHWLGFTDDSGRRKRKFTLTSLGQRSSVIAASRFDRVAEPEVVKHNGSRYKGSGRRQLANGSGLGNTDISGSQGRSERPDRRPTPWEASELIYCTDGKSRRTQPGLFPLAHGVPSRMGRLRGYGNAINPYVAAEFVAAFMDIR